MNKYFFYFFVIIVYFLIYLPMIQAISMKKQDVLDINTNNSNRKDVCQHYKVDSTTEACDYRFICLGDECQSINYSVKNISLTNNEGKIQNYISDYCIPDDPLCETEKCSSDNDCITNKCMNNTCIISDNSPFTECRTKLISNSFFEGSTYKMICGKLEYSKCNNENECAGFCKESKYSFTNSSICYSQFTYNKEPNAKIGYILLGLYIILFLIVLILYFCC